ncbi:MAG: hypothetical protein LAT64_00280 [Phycisphaerales bacterium]|nr:hypothetical protein [Planctomycetota bacterium]MCH8507198.1 hypothetical protein [Phycisphaerales bacterium]
MPKARNPAGGAQTEAFEPQAVAVMHGLRDAFLGLLEGLPGSGSRAVDLEKALGVSRTLGWQIHRVATSHDPLAVAAHVPGLAAVEQALRSARAAGVAEDRVQRVDEAMRRFEDIVQHHAGDRAVFVTMLGSLAGEPAASLDLRTRRQAFRLESQVWGVQVKTFVACAVLAPGSDPSLMDMVLIRGLRDVRRLRAGVPMQVSGQQIVDSDRKPTVPMPLDADEPLKEGSGPSLLAGFCSQPVPRLETRIEDGCLNTFLSDAELGNSGIKTVYLADITRGMRWRSEPQDRNHHIRTATVLKPSEVVVLDTLIHRDMFGTLPAPTARVHGSLARLGERNPYAYRDDETLPIEPEHRRLGAGSGVLTTPHVPRYREMVESVLAGVGWDPAAFDAYRCVVEYPPLGSMVWTRFAFPERGLW